MIKKLIILISLIFLSSIVSIGQDTKTTTINKGDSIIYLPKAVAKINIAELLRKDYLEEENKTLRKNIELMQRNLVLKDSIIGGNNQIISFYKQKSDNDDKIMVYKDMQLTNQSNTIKGLDKQLRKTKVKGIFGTSILGAAVVYFLYTTISNSIK